MFRTRQVTVLLLAVSFVAAAPRTVRAQPAAQDERVAASFVLALGRTPTAAELSQWTTGSPASVADLLARHRQQLQSDGAAAQNVAAKAAVDALGRAPAQDDPATSAGSDAYLDAMKRHLGRLAGQPAEYEQVLHRAYRLVFARDPYDVEIAYWKRQPVLSYALLAGCLDNWGRRNQPGLMATTGVATVSINSPYLVAVRLSPAVAAEARMAAGLAPGGDRTAALARARNIVAPGAAEVASDGGIHFAAAGSDRVTPPR